MTKGVSIRLHSQQLLSDRSSAQKFLSSLDDNPIIGRLIDQTRDYEYEQAQMLQKTGEDLTPEMWIMKCVMIVALIGDQ